MAQFLFIDESGHDHRESPYEVLAGITVADNSLWKLVQAVQAAEERVFGCRYTLGSSELKGKKLLNSRVFRKASQLPTFTEDDRRMLAQRCLEDGSHAGLREITALAQAKLAYVREVLRICARFQCRAFASIVSPDAPRLQMNELLRKDYAYLFERFFYYLEEIDAGVSGIIVFDELEKSRSHLLVNQMDRYFVRTSKGRQRSRRIIPEPFFVHSDLTTGIQIVDLVAYIVSWGWRIPGLVQPAREELADFASQVCQLRYHTMRTFEDGQVREVWGFMPIDDLRGQREREIKEKGNATPKRLKASNKNIP